MPSKLFLAGLAVLLMHAPGLIFAQEHVQAKAVESESERDARMAWWKEARFGMFVHWGVYSVVGGKYKGQDLPNSAEWMMCRGKIPISEYQQYAAQFNPIKFDADEFVGRAKRAGMKYIVITAKHHDGFAMFDSAAGDYNVVDKTPFGRDIMKELADACQKQGIKFGFYYSQAQDWHHPGGFGNNWDKSIKRVSSDEYVMNKAVPEVKQLLTDYGPIGIFWWDTPRKMSKESFNALHSLTGLQKETITNDRLGDDFPGDYKTFERHIPQQAPAGKDWEVCMPISGSWGYKIGDNKFKSTTKLIQNLVTISSMGGNYLLNVSPTGEGTLLPPALERLEAIGKWMDVNGESIYGTSASPFADLEWGKCTRKELDGKTKLYLHVFDWPEDGQLIVPGLKNSIEKASLLDGGAKLETRSVESGVIVSLPAEATDSHASVIVLDVAGKMDVEPQLPTFNKEGSLLLTADKAYINNNEGSKDAGVRKHDDIPHIGYWLDNEASVEWQFRTKAPGTFEVHAELSVAEEKTRFGVGLVDAPLMVEVESTGGYGKYKKQVLGTIEIKTQGDQILRVKPDPSAWNPINLRSIELRRVE
ncbi:alpha-L-fucosidase [Mariniblastus fucicola]|uniref:alpha-L-fucosidase n=1 Tax=Mariniblastus fucicola TaxID=980251 RepID=A0A5B9PQY0_9BACT|nr:alpha-L-fucosidase [Mariniblastus fucicola]QEG24891.1 Alpha-L-fucosidase [Mariniblastus fucicola]